MNKTSVVTNPPSRLSVDRSDSTLESILRRGEFPPSDQLIFAKSDFDFSFAHHTEQEKKEIFDAVMANCLTKIILSNKSGVSENTSEQQGVG